MRRAKAQDFFSDSHFFWLRGGCPFVAKTAALQGLLAAHPKEKERQMDSDNVLKVEYISVDHVTPYQYRG
ncbi:MAG: hypothetical protein ACK5QX_09925, partial [bacterium]